MIPSAIQRGSLMCLHANDEIHHYFHRAYVHVDTLSFPPPLILTNSEIFKSYLTDKNNRKERKERWCSETGKNRYRQPGLLRSGFLNENVAAALAANRVEFEVAVWWWWWQRLGDGDGDETSYRLISTTPPPPGNITDDRTWRLGRRAPVGIFLGGCHRFKEKKIKKEQKVT